jgi:hypothetical protein
MTVELNHRDPRCTSWHRREGTRSDRPAARCSSSSLAAEVCDICGEPFLHTEATAVVSSLLEKALASSAEVSVMTYSAETPVAA